MQKTTHEWRARTAADLFATYMYLPITYPAISYLKYALPFDKRRRSSGRSSGRSRFRGNITVRAELNTKSERENDEWLVSYVCVCIDERGTCTAGREKQAQNTAQDEREKNAPHALTMT